MNVLNCRQVVSEGDLSGLIGDFGASVCLRMMMGRLYVSNTKNV